MTLDQKMMARALDLAREAIFRTSPNPRVGCVLLGKSGEVIGEGATHKAGGPHAEVVALRDAHRRGQSTEGATAYVTLEPCAHFGRTGPCCDALVEAGISRVVVSMLDPNPLVAGLGLERLRAGGVTVDIGLGGPESRELNLGFFSRFLRKRPWVRLKVAASLDGKTALPNGLSQWITGPEARADGHYWRARSCAMLTGVGTVLADNPRLDVREVATERQPRLVVVDSQLRTPLNAAIFETPREVLIYSLSTNRARIAALEQRGAVVISLPSSTQRVDLAKLLQDLAVREVNELHVEAGQTLNAALMRESLVDELLVYLAPCLLGQGMDMFPFGPLSTLQDRIALEFRSTEPVGKDLRIVARVKGRDDF